MLTETVKAEIRRLIDAIDEDGPSSRLFTQLEQTLAREPAARRYYLRLMGLRSNLRQIAVASEIEHRDSSLLETLSQTEAKPSHADGDESKRFSVSGRWMVLAGVLAMFVVAIQMRSRPNGRPVAEIVELRNAWWSKVEGQRAPERRLAIGQWLSLSGGSVDLRFQLGARVTVKAPSRFQILSDNSLMLADGTLTADVPPTAKGFTVKTPGPDVVDFGTEFAVVVPNPEQVDVHVRSGQVAVRSATNSAFRGQEVNLKTEQSLRVLVTRGVTQSLPFAGQLFAKSNLTSELIAIHFRAGERGNQGYTGKLGTDFVVHHPIIVTQLGVFDSGADGLKQPLTCELWSRDAAGTPDDVSDDRGVAKLATIEFTSTHPGQLVDGSRIRKLPRELRLEPGHYSVVAHGFGGREPNGNDFGRHAFSHAIGFNNGGGLITFLGPGRFTALQRDIVSIAPDSFPTMIDNVPAGHPNFFAAGTFRYRAAGD
jgi:hypothetical protein